ncbi:cytochrome P450 [Xylariales sp. PMI_506]|nr:cytochrome P450 [Xylariales sp. PMI_506]
MVTFPPHSIAEAVLLIILTVAAYTIGILIYNATLHPLRSYPGPLLSRMSILPYLRQLAAGDLHRHVAELHRKYGPVVRIAPNQLSFTDPSAWKDIYGRRKSAIAPSGFEELSPDPLFYGSIESGKKTKSPGAMLGAPAEHHDPIRRALAPSFSPTALRNQEHVIQSYVNLLVDKLKQAASAGEPVNMTSWINFATFDLMGALAFSSDFGCLRESTYHPWIRIIMGNLKGMMMMQIFRHLGLLEVFTWLANQFSLGLEARKIHIELTEGKVRQRLDMHAAMKEEGRSDLFEALIDSGFGFETLKGNAGLIVIAGSETTGTMLCGAVYLLTSHPEYLAKVTEEVRSRFTTDDDITLSSVNGLTYMLACLDESFRVYPPVAITGPRVTAKGGSVIAGNHVAENTTVGVYHWAMSHSPDLFVDPEEFRPERFVGDDPRYKDDRLDAVQPFIVGFRDCVGRNLAYAEMRLILAKLLWHFDMRLAEESKNWVAVQKNYLLWEKPPLYVHLDVVAR